MRSQTVKRIVLGVTFTIAAAVLVSASPSSAMAQSTLNDQGSFRILIDGAAAGSERFTIRHTGTGGNRQITATGEVDARLESGTVQISSQLRASGFDANPIAYEVTIGGTSPQRIVGQIAGGRFSARITSPSGEQLREYVASSGATILDDGVAHHYYFLANRTHNGRVPVLIPRENRQVMATVTAQGREMMEIGGVRREVTRLDIQLDGGAARQVRVDDQNRVIRVDIPSRSYIAIRTEFP